METVHAEDSPLAHYLQANGSFEPDSDPDLDDNHSFSSSSSKSHRDLPDTPASEPPPSFAPSSKLPPQPRLKLLPLDPPSTRNQTPPPKSAITRTHDAWSTAWNSRVLHRANARFTEHFRYTIVASQLLNEYLDHGTLNQSPTPCSGLDGAEDLSTSLRASASIYGVVATAVVALVLAGLIAWSRSHHGAFWTNGRLTLALSLLAVLSAVAYRYGRRQWLKTLRRQAVDAATTLTTSWQAFELSSSSTLGFIQEVELVSKGYRLSTPLPPISRIDDNTTSRSCAKLRRGLYKAYSHHIPACIEAYTTLRGLIDDDDLDRYFEVYDISPHDAKEAVTAEAISAIDDDVKSLRALRVFSYRSGVLRRVILCALMALESDGGKPDMHRWEIANNTMRTLSQTIASSAERIRQLLTETEQFSLPSPATKNSPNTTTHTPSRREKMRSQVRKISALSSGIRGLQAKMQILREETNHSIEQSDDLTDLGPSLMAQYESIGSDLRDLMQAWEAGKQSLQSNIKQQENRISLASSQSMRSPQSSIGGLTAVEEDGFSPADALRVLNGEKSKSQRSSLVGTTDEEGGSSSSSEQVFEAVALPRQRAGSILTREERIQKMNEARERQAQQRAKRDASTNMMRELESVINLRTASSVQHKQRSPLIGTSSKNGGARITSI